MSDEFQKYIDDHTKSYETGFILTFFFGPLGLFYSSWLAALILCVIAIACAVSGALNIVSIVVLCWPLAIFIGFVAVGKHNEKVKNTATARRKWIKARKLNSPLFGTINNIPTKDNPEKRNRKAIPAIL